MLRVLDEASKVSVAAQSSRVAHDEEMAFGAVLRRARDGRSMAWLSEKSGIKQDRLYRLSSGRTEVTLGELGLIADALNVPAAMFLPGGAS